MGTSKRLTQELWMTPRGNKIGGYSREDFAPTLEQQVGAQSTFSPVVSLANPSALRENVRALVTSVSSGTKCSASYARYSPFGYWEKTSGVCSPLMEVEPSEPSSMTWPKWAIAWDGACMELATSKLRIVVSGSSLLPTPVSVDGGSYFNKSQSEGAALRPTLGAMAKYDLWPTPAYSQMAKPARPLAPSEANGTHRTMLVGAVGDADPETIGGSLNPEWVEWLQGFPIGWTDLGHSETP
jgi:hypothetical protein